MSLFVEVTSIEKQCKVIVNMEHIVEIAPLATGGCALFTIDSAGVGAKASMRVADDYSQFVQFAVQPVSADDIAKRFPKVSAESEPKAKSSKIDIPKL